LKGKHVLITGHTGFKGSWLMAMLHNQGARVSGIALDPVQGGIFNTADLKDLLVHDLREDIRDAAEVTKSLQLVEPDIVIHLAAQPLVLSSYENPQETYETNVMGTLNVLQAVEATGSVEATLIITTDKVYRQETGGSREFVESDPLGAADPYSTSKAMADLLTQSWIASHPECKIGIARAGNVIGGGDNADNRLLPDLINAFSTGQTAWIRSPLSTRPWQHVLDCLTGYILLAEGLVSRKVDSGPFNFGPSSGFPNTVAEISEAVSKAWGDDSSWKLDLQQHYKEEEYLALNSDKSFRELGWSEKLDKAESINWTVDWHKAVLSGESAHTQTFSQIEAYLARKSNTDFTPMKREN